MSMRMRVLPPYLQGMLLGLLVLVAVWALASCKWRLDEAVVRLSDLRPDLQKEWLSWGHMLAFASDPVALYEATNGAAWTNSTGWSGQTSPCDPAASDPWEP